MRAPKAIVLALALAGLAGTAHAEDPFADAASVAEGELDTQRGGTETATQIDGSVIQTNETSQSSSNNGSISVGNDAIKANGRIHEATVSGNHGITAVMQNTGDLVNMSNATSVNVFLK